MSPRSMQEMLRVPPHIGQGFPVAERNAQFGTSGSNAAASTTATAFNARSTRSLGKRRCTNQASSDDSIWSATRYSPRSMIGSVTNTPM